MKIIKSRFFVPIVFAVLFVLGLIFWKTQGHNLTRKNPNKIQYISMKKFSKAIESKRGPKGEKSFMIAFGSDSCGACTQLYRSMNKYREENETKSWFVPFYTTDLDTDKNYDTLFIDHFYQQDYRTWASAEIKSIERGFTPITMVFINNEIKDIIGATTTDHKKITEYIKSVSDVKEKDA